jgi:hypothetical protein
MESYEHEAEGARGALGVEASVSLLDAISGDALELEGTIH